MVVGLNYRTALVAVRERFWINENRRYEALLNYPGRKASTK
jgi:glutamyl-tRNA reductase